MLSPNRLSHLVLQTNRLTDMRDWYCDVLNAKVAFENEVLCFLAYEEEHHRIALVSFGNCTPEAEDSIGMHHVSFDYETLEDLLENWERLSSQGVTPEWTMNHGPTISLYYRDPEGNRLELQTDVFATNEEVNGSINGPIYRENPIGTEFDPREMLNQLRSGTTASLLAR
jgi:catechol-2,3-dioxygenase